MPELVPHDYMSPRTEAMRKGIEELSIAQDDDDSPKTVHYHEERYDDLEAFQMEQALEMSRLDAEPDAFPSSSGQRPVPGLADSSEEENGISRHAWKA